MSGSFLRCISNLYEFQEDKKIRITREIRLTYVTEIRALFTHLVYPTLEHECLIISISYEGCDIYNISINN